ncbi:MAG: hypothetical protein P1V81_17125 [Planctomycetota bacterium]|nr:hypothetical protein [Planctomycetota bacterium]
MRAIPLAAVLAAATLLAGCGGDTAAAPKGLPAEHAGPALAWADAGKARLVDEFEAGAYPRFVFDKRASQLRFHGGAGPDLEFPAQVIGSWSAEAGAYLWAWADEQLSDDLRAPSAAAKQLAKSSGSTAFGLPTFPADQDSARAHSSLAAQQLGGFAIFRLPKGSHFTFLAVFEPAAPRQGSRAAE